MTAKSFTFEKLPVCREDLQAYCGLDLSDPYQTAALSCAALCCWGTDREAAIDMLNALKGPQPLSNYEMQFIRDRLSGKEYKPRSYFEGTSPENGYTIPMPARITVSDNPY